MIERKEQCRAATGPTRKRRPFHLPSILADFAGQLLVSSFEDTMKAHRPWKYQEVQSA